MPVFEEFIPIKRASSDSDGEEHDSKKYKNETSDCDSQGRNSSEKSCKKSDWLRSVQLWNQTPDPPSKEVNLRGIISLFLIIKCSLLLYGVS